MKGELETNSTFSDGLKHYFLAGVLFAAFLGGSLEFVILFTLGKKALFLFQGVPGMIVESIVLWCAIMISAHLLRHNRHIHNTFGVALSSTGFSVLTSLIALPYLSYFSNISHMSTTYLILKEVLHTFIFYSATMIYFNGFSLRALFKNKHSQEFPVVQ